MKIMRYPTARHLYQYGKGKIYVSTLKQYIKEGVDFTVYDSRTKTDVTDAVLKQVIVSAAISRDKLFQFLKENA